MISLFRPLTHALTIALLVLTSAAMAKHRAAAPVAGQIVICNGTGFQTISLDADGNEVTPGPICPDCALSLAILAGEAPATAHAPLALSAHLPALKPGPSHPTPIQTPPSRAPPVLF